jgi:hypothetical protein
LGETHDERLFAVFLRRNRNGDDERKRKKKKEILGLAGILV